MCASTRLGSLRRFSLRALVALTPLTVMGCDRAGDSTSWSQWRGRNGSGVVEGTALPTRWSADSGNVRWRTKIPGRGNSSPVVGDGRVYLTAAVGESDDADDRMETAVSTPSDLLERRARVALALDLATGELLWQREILHGPSEARHKLNSFAAPTPVVDDEGVYVYFGSVLAKLDAEEGEILWTKEVDPHYAQFSRYGAASSPILAGGAVIVFSDREWAGTEDSGWLAAYDRETGAELWRTEWFDTCCAYSTPIVVRGASGDRLLIAMSGGLAEFDPATGERLWFEPYAMTQMVGSPTYEDGLVLIAGGANNRRGIAAIRLSGEGAETQRELLWHTIKYAPQNASSVYYRSLLVSATDSGILSIYEGETGSLAWKTRLSHARNRASLVAGDGKIYVVSSGGMTTVIGLDPEPHIVAENDLEESGSNASPAIVDGSLLIRMQSHLVRIDKEQA